MHFSVGFILAALVRSAMSSPSFASKRGIKIALQKGTGAIDAKGVANGAWFNIHMTNIQAKYDQGFANYEKNTGLPHPLAVNRSSSLGRRATGSDPLTDDYLIWYGTISVGTPPNQYTVRYDTGSSDLFLPGPNCYQNCGGHTTFNPSQSSTSVDLGQVFYLQYADGSTVFGEQYTDTVTIAGLTATTQTLGVASAYSPGFLYSPADGLMGMGYQSISSYNAPPVFQTMVSQGQTSAGVFSFKLASSGSELFLGGTDSAAYTGPFTYTPVIKQGFWQVNMDSISVNGAQANGKNFAIIDTGTTLLVGDSSNVQQVIAMIPGAQSAPAAYGSGYYMAPCNSLSTVTVSLTFSGTSWDINPATLNLGQIQGDPTNCLVGIANDPLNAGFWVVGETFLRNVYVAFDLDSNQVGFAKQA